MRLGKGLFLVTALVCALSAGVANGQSVSDTDFLYFVPASRQVSNNIDTNWKWAVWVNNKTTLGAISFPLTFGGLTQLRIDSAVLTAPDIKGVTYGPAGTSGAGWTLRTSLLSNTAKTILLGFITFAEFTPHNDTLCYIHFDLDASGVNTVINVDTGVVNGQHLAFTDTFAEDHIPTWTRGVLTVGGVSVGGEAALPLAYGLDQNLPNPFNAQTKISFSMPKADNVKLTIFNVLGQEVKVLIDGKMDANRHDVIWDGTNGQGSVVASGTYFYRLKIGDAFEETRQMTLLK